MRRFFPWQKSRRLQKLRRTPRIFIPTPSRFAIVIPFRLVSLWLTILLSLTSLYLLLRSDVFLVKSIQISWVTRDGQPRYIDETKLREELSSYWTRSIFLIRAPKIEAAVAGGFLPVKKVRVQKKWPDRLLVAVEEREALAIVEVVHWEQLLVEERQERRDRYLVDEAGLLFSRPRPGESLPGFELASDEPPGLGDYLDGELIRAALAVLTKLREFPHFSIAQLSLGPPNLIFLTATQGWQATFRVDNPPLADQLYSLQIVAKEAKMKGRELRSVDLRYRPPVVRW